MRVLIYGINYAPELTGIGKYTGEMGAWLAQQGHRVTVITAVPYYPEWVIHPTHKNKGWHTEVIDDVEVHRCPLYVPNQVTSIKRILHEFSFVLSSLVFWIPILFGKKYDKVIGVCPPFHLGFLPLIYSKIRKVPFVCHIQDLQVDAARDLGMIKNQRFLKLMLGAERYILINGTAVSTISSGMQKKIEYKGISPSKIIMFPNWVDVNTIQPMPKEMSLRKEFKISDEDKVVLYSGNLGEKQGLDLLIEAARWFNSSKVSFVIVGSGGGKAKLQELVKQYNLNNVHFFPLQPHDKLAALLAAADLHLVLQKKSAADLMLPSKLTNIMAAGGCSLVTAQPNTTLYDTITNHELGIVVEPESVEALIYGIKNALEMDLSIYQRNAKLYAQNHISKVSVLKNFEENLMRLQA
ncbi:WcaI family glycosyltransferase [Telluribacter humicola]|uniref:WcaI family glycosyltransferase n=1 Tax=Telluribacter humicola TaxID=1720261 RepID=UPI001A95A9C7|nr:WcaI family glycosyltransferase [Telluribacter humicola]